MVALFVIGIILAFRIENSKGVFLVLLTVLTFVISDILSFKMPMLPRYLIILTIVFFIGIAVSYRLLYSLWSNKAVVYGFIIVLFVISAPVLATGITRGIQRKTGEDFPQPSSRRPYRVMLSISVPGYISQPLDYYYSSTKAQTKE